MSDTNSLNWTLDDKDGVALAGDADFRRLTVKLVSREADAQEALRLQAQTHARDLLRESSARALEGRAWVQSIPRLDGELQDARAQLAAARAKLAEVFNRRNALVAAGGAGLTQHLTKLNTEHSKLAVSV